VFAQPKLQPSRLSVSAPRRPPRRRELRVVFDTNPIHNTTPDHPVSAAVSSLLNEKPADVDLIPYLPEVVRHEREFRMRAFVDALAAPLSRMESLLGHGIGINIETLRKHVTERIDEQIGVYGFRVLPFAPERVDWPRVLLDAVYRRAPFQVGRKGEGLQGCPCARGVRPTGRRLAHGQSAVLAVFGDGRQAHEGGGAG
jgi:hypothetical protein